MPERLYKQHSLEDAYAPILQTVGEELIVYDPLTDQAHTLETNTALVYRHCDGETLRTTVMDKLVAGENGLERSLQALADAGLIAREEPTSVKRRDFLATAGRGALLAPLVMTVAVSAPAAAMSVSCETGGSTACTIPLGGGASGNGPSACSSCCEPVGAFCSCPGGCSTCNCMKGFFCSDDGTNSRPCNGSAGPDICSATSTDFADPNRTCSFDGSNARIRNSCAAARVGAIALNATGYFCCECP